jgi:hypothetical protein
VTIGVKSCFSAFVRSSEVKTPEEIDQGDLFSLSCSPSASSAFPPGERSITLPQTPLTSVKVANHSSSA